MSLCINRRFQTRISAATPHMPVGRSRTFRLTEGNIAELVAIASLMEAPGAMTDDRLTPRARADREAWKEYRKWEDRHFPIDPVNPFKDPPGMVTARRAFEREQEISKAEEILRLREASRVR